MGWVSKYDVWVSHELSEKNWMDCVAVCVSLLDHLKFGLFLESIIIRDEKWIFTITIFSFYVERKK